MGLSVVDWQAFSVIARSDVPLTAGEMSELTQLPTSTTTRVLDRLERAGYIERRADSRDRRRVVVLPRSEVVARFTSDGGDNPYTAIKGTLRSVHQDFSPEELEIVGRYLRAVNLRFR
nr:helix-turn-helix domain-containing protein [Brevibacterium yomogidense]